MGDYALTVCPICHMDVENCVCSSAIKQEPMPNGLGINVQDEVIKDMRERMEFGKAKYGQYLKTFNGRNALKDAYQEVLDLAVYLKQRILEEEANET